MVKPAGTPIAISQSDEPGRAVTQSLEALPLSGRIRGRIVAVKPNDTWASRADTTAVTQPDTLRAVIRYLKTLQPAQIVVSGGAGAAETRDVFEIAGLMDVIREEDVEFFDHNRPPFVKVSLDYGPQKSVFVNKRVLGYETLVSLCQLKVHDSATVTLSLKNIAMSYPAADYYGHPRSTRLHDNDFFTDLQTFIAQMALRFPIGLAVIAGHPAMIGTGPIGGKTVETGLVIAGTDAVAVDTAGAKMLGFNVSAVRHIQLAGNYGAGTTDLDEIRFPLMSLTDAIRLFTRRAYGREMTYEHL